MSETSVITNTENPPEVLPLSPERPVSEESEILSVLSALFSEADSQVLPITQEVISEPETSATMVPDPQQTTSEETNDLLLSVEAEGTANSEMQLQSPMQNTKRINGDLEATEATISGENEEANNHGHDKIISTINSNATPEEDNLGENPISDNKSKHWVSKYKKQQSFYKMFAIETDPYNFNNCQEVTTVDFGGKMATDQNGVFWFGQVKEMLMKSTKKGLKNVRKKLKHNPMSDEDDAIRRKLKNYKLKRKKHRGSLGRLPQVERETDRHSKGILRPTSSSFSHGGPSNGDDYLPTLFARVSLQQTSGREFPHFGNDRTPLGPIRASSRPPQTDEFHRQINFSINRHSSSLPPWFPDTPMISRRASSGLASGRHRLAPVLAPVAPKRQEIEANAFSKSSRSLVLPRIGTKHFGSSVRTPTLPTLSEYPTSQQIFEMRERKKPFSSAEDPEAALWEIEDL